MPPMAEPASVRRFATIENARDGERLVGEADEAERAVELEEREVGVDVVRGGDAVEDEVEAAGVLAHGGGIFGEDDFVGAELFGVFDLGLADVVNWTTCAPKA